MNTIQDYIKTIYTAKEIKALATHEFTITTTKARKLYLSYQQSIDAVCNQDFTPYLNFVFDYCNHASTIKPNNHLKVEFTLKKLARELCKTLN